MVGKITFRGDNIDKVKEFAGDACEIKPVYDNNGVVWGQRAVIKTPSCLVELMPNDIVIKDDKGIHVCRRSLTFIE